MPMTVNQAAEYLQVTPMSVYRWISTGQLRAGRAGRLIRIRKEDLDAFAGLEIDLEKEPQQA